MSSFLVACGGQEEASSSSSNKVFPNIPTPEEFYQIENPKLPPGLDQSESLSGVDVDNNGVRDDIQACIDAQDNTLKQKNGLFNLAKSLQAIMVSDLKGEATIISLGESHAKRPH